MMKDRKKPEASPEQAKEPEMAVVDFEKLFYETVVEIMKEPGRQHASIARRIPRTQIRDQILHADTWPERDQLIKSLAAKCYGIANSLRKPTLTRV